MKFQLTQEQLQTIVNYLVTRPYNDVFQILDMIRALPPVAEVPSPVAPIEPTKTSESVEPEVQKVLSRPKPVQQSV